MSPILVALASVLMFLVTLTPIAHAQKTQDSAAKGESKEFVTKAAKGSQAEVELGRLARDRAKDDAVKEFADRMVSDHGKARDELATLAQKKGMTVPSDLGEHKGVKTRLEQLKGDAFDRAYVSAMLKDHKKDVAEFRREAEKNSDPDVKAWATKTLPTLEEHLRLVETLAKKLNVS